MADIPEHFYETARAIRNGVIWESNAATRVLAEALYGAWKEGVAQYATTETVTPDDVAGLVFSMRNWEGNINLDPTDLIEDAATALEALSAALASERAAHAETRRERDEAFQKYVDANEARIDAEAQRDEALKALEPFAELAGEVWADEFGWTDSACQNDRICDWFGPSAFFAARRALEGGE